MINEARIHFLGASGTVTGSKFLLEVFGKNILIDCGMFQGLKELRELNWQKFKFPPAEIDLVLLTHGHLDHTGALPRLVKEGFDGEIQGTSPSLAIAEIILTDSAKIQQEDAEKANKEHYTIHEPALPLYNEEDVTKTIKLFKTVKPGEWYAFDENIKYRFRPNGHILGSTYIELEIGKKIFIFSGDIGQENDLLLKPPLKPERADYLFLESTYGDRLHPDEDPGKILQTAIEKTLEKQGILIIPSFAVERLQSLMYHIYKLREKNLIPDIPLYIDSPMGHEVLKVFSRFLSWHKLSNEEFRSMRKTFRIITNYRDTWKTIEDTEPKVVIAGSGMVTGGRVLTYLRFFIEDPRTTILLAGYQAEGTRGRQIQEGLPEIKIFGKYHKLKAAVQNINSLSAHADQQGLLNWLTEIKDAPQRTFLIHGENKAADVLRVKIRDRLGWKAEIPHLGQIVTVEV
jgi:metallo-beta-lactamase family protein